VDIGVFDHLDRRNVPLDEHYASRLRLLEKYDAAGFHAYHLAEHHATPLGMAPAPGIFLAAATQRTRRIRLGPCVYCLPLYDPLRLIEEICMLDQMSRGRFDLGVGRGIVPYEMAYFDLHPFETEEIYREALEVILAGLTNEVLEHRGPRYTYRKVPMVLRPFQKPHPPLWYGLGHDRGAEWAATNGVHVLSNHPAEGARDLFARYREVWHRKQGTAPMPKLGMTRHVVVAETDAEAEAIARPNYGIWYANLTKLWRDFGSTPIRFARDFEEARQRGLAVAGTAARVREELERQIAVSTCTYLVIRPIFGDVTEAQATASTDRFASEVLGHLTALKPTS
jgi:alkanesulfonate monooxygenase SsuD/methylene tetrahydromethanopterin reductase-like flavin-dependent oxidoreductase (luciferase family)